MSRLGRELAEARERLRHAESDSDESEDGDGEGNNNTSKHGISAAGDDHEKPSEDMVDRMEERLEAAQADQKNLFLIVFQARLWSYVVPLKQPLMFDHNTNITILSFMSFLLTNNFFRLIR